MLLLVDLRIVDEEPDMNATPLLERDTLYCDSRISMSIILGQVSHSYHLYFDIRVF